MTMNYYAPFYRPSFYTPNQMLPDNVNQFNQQYQQQPQMQTNYLPVQNQQGHEMVWVLNENEATSYPVLPNNTAILWDKNLPTIYIKSVNSQGMPSIRILDFTERVQGFNNSPRNDENNTGNTFVTADEFNTLKQKFEALTARFEELKSISGEKNTKLEEDGND